MTCATAFPLCWPETFPRAKTREQGKFSTSLGVALNNVETSLARFGNDSGKRFSNVVLSSNCTLGVARPADPGVAVWFVWDGLQVNGEPRLVHLPPDLVATSAAHPRGLDRQGRLFRFRKSGRLYSWLGEAAAAAGVTIPPRVAFHAFRHTWRAWMRRYGGLDTTGLVEAGAWRSRQGAATYEHAVQSEEARHADALPAVWKIRGNRK